MRNDASSLDGTAARSAAGDGRERLVAGGALLGAFLSSTCCIVPLALFMLGVGGSWIGTLTSLAPYQPLFLIPTLGILAYGYRRVYGRPAACEDDRACARPLPRRLVELSLWVATALLAAAAAFPWLAPLVLAA